VFRTRLHHISIAIHASRLFSLTLHHMILIASGDPPVGIRDLLVHHICDPPLPLLYVNVGQFV
jgi:hypothetical protein